MFLLFLGSLVGLKGTLIPSSCLLEGEFRFELVANANMLIVVVQNEDRQAERDGL